MYYTAIDGLTYVSKLAAQVSESNFNSIPLYDVFSQGLQSLLPQNFINVNASGMDTIRNNTIFTNLLNGNVSNLLPTIQSNTINELNVVKGVTPVYTTQHTNSESFSQTNNALLQNSQQFSQVNSSQVNTLYTQNAQSSQLGSLNQVVAQEYASYNAISPRARRDLRDENVFSDKVATSTDNIKNNLFNTSSQLTKDQVQNPVFNNSAQNSLQQLSSPRYSGDNTQGFDLYVRRTVYWAYGPATDIDSANLRSSTGRQLSQNISAAVDPSIIPYLSRIEFPDIGTRYATDTGGAVIAKAASKGTVPVIDVFFLKREDAIAFANSTPPYITVKVYPPATKYKYAANSAPTYGIA